MTAILGQGDVSVRELPAILSSVVEEGPAAILLLKNLSIPSGTSRDAESANDGDLAQNGGGTEKGVQPLDADIVFLAKQEFARRTPSLTKLHRLLGILEARLGQIVEWWDGGVLKAAGFTAEEVRRLIYACFEHSEYREDCIGHVR